MKIEKMVTLESIEKKGRERLKLVEEELRGCYLETYGIHNPWTAWVMRQNSRLVERRGICEWTNDYEYTDAN